LPDLCYWCGQLTHDDRDCELWIDSKGTLKVEQSEFGPQLRAPPFVVIRKNAILVPGYYATKKKGSSSTSVDRDSGQNSISSRERRPKQSQGVTADRDDSIQEDIIPSLIRNKGDKIRKEDTVLKDIINEGITVGKTPNVTEPDLEANNEEVCLAKEFGAVTLQGSRKRTSKNPSSRDKLSDSSQLKKSHDSQVARALHLDSIHAAPT